MIVYFSIFFISVIITILVRKIAIKKSLLAKVNERSSHTIATPTGGGVAIIISWFLGLIYLYLKNNIEKELFFALSSAIIISIVSFLDDIYELSPKIRLFFQLITAILGLYFLNFFSYNLFFVIIALFLIVWYINLYNFLDGINGYAGGEAIFLAIAGYILFNNDIFLILIASVAGFLIFNYRQKAKIFMGDVGSTLLGYNIAIFTLYYSKSDFSNFFIWIILFSPYLADATFTLYKRFKNNEKLTKAHKKHYYQRIVQAGWSHIKTTNFLLIINLIILVIICSIKNIYIDLILALFLNFIVMRYIDSKFKFR